MTRTQDFFLLELMRKMMDAKISELIEYLSVFTL